MKVWPKIFFFLQFFLLLIIAGLPFINQKRIDNAPNIVLKEIYTFLDDYSLVASLVITAVLFVIASSQTIFFPSKYAKQVRANIMETMIEELFAGDQQDIRVTIFKDANRLQNASVYLKQVWKCLIGRMKSKKIPFPRLGKCIIVWERLGLEFPNSKTFFHFSPDTHKKCQGIAGLVRHNLESLSVYNLPHIENINLTNFDINSKSRDAKQVKKYMGESNIQDLETLRRLNRRSRHYYGDVLFNREGNPKGVLIVDSVKEQCPFTAETAQRLSYYIKMIGYTL